MSEVKSVTKKVITAQEYEKRVQIETQNLIYLDRMKEHEAAKEAVRYVQSKFTVQ